MLRDPSLERGQLTPTPRCPVRGVIEDLQIALTELAAVEAALATCAAQRSSYAGRDGQPAPPPPSRSRGWRSPRSVLAAERVGCYRAIEDNPPVAFTFVEVVGKRSSVQRLGVLT